MRYTCTEPTLMGTTILQPGDEVDLDGADRAGHPARAAVRMGWLVPTLSAPLPEPEAAAPPLPVSTPIRPRRKR